MPGCGATAFLRQHEDFVFEEASLIADKTLPLFDRASLGPPHPRSEEDDIPF